MEIFDTILALYLDFYRKYANIVYMKPFYEKVPVRETSSFFAYEKIVEAFDFSWHYHPEYEITAITNGSGKRYVGDCIDEYSSPDVVLLPPDVPHSWQSLPRQDNNVAVVVQFSAELIKAAGLSLPEFNLIRRLLDNSGGGLYFNDDGCIIPLMKEIAATDGIESFINLIKLLVHLSKLSARVIGTSSLSRSRDNCDNINRLFNYINDNFTSEISLGGAAKAACMSESAFCRFFKRTCGRRFIDHINDLRVSLACRLLAETDKGITQICFEAGFTNIANFNRQFKRRKAQSPRQYRRLHQPGNNH